MEIIVPLLHMSDLDLADQRVLIREDFNVPMENGVITSDARIIAALPTIQKALAQGAKIILVSHLGRPEEGIMNPAYSLRPVAEKLSVLLGQSVRCIEHWIDGFPIESGEIVLCENVRFLKGENNNDETLSRKMAHLCDIFVMDAFATAHRAQASTYGVAEYAKVACAGPLLFAELSALNAAIENPQHPVLAIVGGSKISTKLSLLEHLCEKVDTLIVGGGIANTLIKAAGYSIGSSLYEPDLVNLASQLIQQAKSSGKKLPIPRDVRVAKTFSSEAESFIRTVDSIQDDEMILDIGPETIAFYEEMITTAQTIIWNGPVGVFEFDAFAQGTQAIAEAIACSDAFSLAGGGDTIAALEKFHVLDKISYVSTAGGAFLEFMEGKKLPAIEILEKRAN
jgi:phosphoglycerate kinase